MSGNRIDILKLFGESAASDEPQVNKHANDAASEDAAWAALRVQMREMFSARDYLDGLPADSDVRRELEQDSRSAADRMVETIDKLVSQGDYHDALGLAMYLADTMDEELGPNDTTVIQAIIYAAQLQHQLGDSTTAAGLAGDGLRRLGDEGATSRNLECYQLNRLLGLVHYETGNYQNALDAYTAAGIAAESLGDQNEVRAAVHDMARCYRGLCKFDKATELLTSLLDSPSVTRTVSEALKRAAILSDLGSTRAEPGEHEAASPLREALKQAAILSDMGLARSESEEHEAAPSPSREALKQAAILSDLGSTRAESGQHEAALSPLREALEIRLAFLPDSQHDVATSLHNISRTLEYLGRNEEAAVAREQLAKFLAPQHPAFVGIMNEWADRLIELDQINDARSTLREITRFAIVRFGKAHPIYASVAENWGRVSFRSAHLGAARRSFVKAAEVWEPGSPDSARVLGELAKIDIAEGEQETALQRLDQARAAVVSTMGEDNYFLGEIEAIRALALQSSSLDEAIPAYVASVVSRQNQFGQSDPRTAIAKNNLGAALFEKQDYRSAEPLFTEALEVLSDAYHQSHRSVIAAASNLAATYARQQRLDDAEIIHETLRQRLENSVAPNRNLNLAQLFNNVACTEIAAEQPSKAIMTLRKAAALVPESELLNATIQHNLAAAHSELEQYKEAEQAYDNAIEILKQRLGADHRLTVEAKGFRDAFLESQREGKKFAAPTIFSLLAA